MNDCIITVIKSKAAELSVKIKELEAKNAAAAEGVKA